MAIECYEKNCRFHPQNEPFCDESECRMNKVMIPKGIDMTEITVKFYQESDSCDSKELGQELRVFTQDAGGGKYLCISTERWAIDEIDDLIVLLKKVKGMCDEF